MTAAPGSGGSPGRLPGARTGTQEQPAALPASQPATQPASQPTSQGAVLDAASCRRNPPSLFFHTVALPPGTLAADPPGATTAAQEPQAAGPRPPGLLDLMTALDAARCAQAAQDSAQSTAQDSAQDTAQGTARSPSTLLGSCSEVSEVSEVSAWVRQGRGMIGLGRSLTITASGQDRVEDLRAAWRAVVGASWWRDALVRPGTGPLALGTITFSPGSAYPSVLLVPEILIGLDEEGGWVTTAVLTQRPPRGSGPEGDGPQPQAGAGTAPSSATSAAVSLVEGLSRAAAGSVTTGGTAGSLSRSALGTSPVTSPGRTTQHPLRDPLRDPLRNLLRAPLGVRSGALSEQAWCQAVTAAQAAMRTGPAHKVVLARDVLVQPGGQVPTSALVARLAQAYPSTWTFAVDQMVGATPELLVRLRERRLTSRVLAGTARRTASGRDTTRNGEDTASLASWLLSSGKNNREHRLALDSALRALEPLCSAVATGSPSPFVLELPNVLHLASDITGVVAGDTGALALVHALHPTAAVCGTPTPCAARLIDQLEGMDRGRYAGPVGWVDWHGEGEWCIALRCAQLPGSTTPGGPPEEGMVRVFGGGGIMPDSQPADELAETSAKMRPVLDALEALTGQPATL